MLVLGKFLKSSFIILPSVEKSFIVLIAGRMVGHNSLTDLLKHDIN
jgi:hypothetical protein